MKKPPSQSNNAVSRRRFLKFTTTAGVGAAVIARAGLAPPKVLGANDRVRLGA
ncbi:MAG: twin-arginine translocation signal domain-containing protein, partial [Pyrinomonadaceae bacterium]|nr:twin-arginine translocation signal domain-containing protein [Pyrinomonadaceae bacterium]